MDILSGNLYFISNAFFEKVNDPFLKINYQETKRPHYFALYDEKTKLFWMVPCSSKVAKYRGIIQKKKERHKAADAIQIVKIFDKESVLLFQDMFPTIAKYIDGQYIKGGQAVRVADPKVIAELEKVAHKIINLLHRGVRFTPTQPDVLHIEQLMLAETQVKKGNPHQPEKS